MKSAIRICSYKGFFKEEIKASEISSRYMARDLGPFVDEAKEKLVHWVDKAFSKETGKFMRSEHFAKYPEKASSRSAFDFDELIRIRDQQLNSSKVHNTCRDRLADSLRRCLEQNQTHEWYFRDEKLSDYNLSGNLFRGVRRIETEYQIPAPFSRNYRLDIALLGDEVDGVPILLSGVELELSHEFESLKCMLCKCIGFPLISLDISDIGELEVEHINGDKLLNMLLETSKTNDSGRRRNFVYIHPMLYPVFIDWSRLSLEQEKHQFIIFCPDKDFEELKLLLKELRIKLGLGHSDFQIQTQNCSNPNADRRVIYNEGPMAGHDWRSYNEDKYLRLSIPRVLKDNDASYLFHLGFAEIVNAIKPSLVGYKYLPCCSRTDDEDIWSVYDTKAKEMKLTCPISLSVPITSILKILEQL